ncbi:hypothetical protein CcCBS67573_g08014 [Chytriomyces confervae]|uniref:Gamma-glutamylcyclotransferase AIG2-like domain-containing protein n=1 Tax=Chytriomyces confervae TaxID=246404 RepID=A0A507EPP2_9FUNG|nr:hypothetical protein HDU80_010863 [Chytriomyces hyalinus]TPX65801.1 hypothetical protein CcCBS67573_g08014 [Chytriomyces confervae]
MSTAMSLPITIHAQSLRHALSTHSDQTKKQKQQMTRLFHTLLASYSTPFVQRVSPSHPPPPAVYVFAYGSLINPSSLQRTIGSTSALPSHQSHSSIKTIPAVVSGFKRSWEYKCSRRQYTAVSVTRDESAATNGVLVQVQWAQLRALDARESGYTRELITMDKLRLYEKTDELNNGHYAAMDSNNLPSNAIVFMYTLDSSNNHTASPSVPIPQSYVDCIVAGALQTHGYAFAREFIQTTAGWAAHWVNDRNAVAPVRRYVPDCSAGERDLSPDLQDAVDELLKAVVPNAFMHRVDV